MNLPLKANPYSPNKTGMISYKSSNFSSNFTNSVEILGQSLYRGMDAMKNLGKIEETKQGGD